MTGAPAADSGDGAAAGSTGETEQPNADTIVVNQKALQAFTEHMFDGIDASIVDQSDEGMHDPLFGDVHIFEFARGALLTPVVRTSDEWFTSTAISAEDPGGPALVVNGEEYDASKSQMLLEGLIGPLDPSDTITAGEVIRNGRIVAGTRSSPQGFFVSETLDDKGMPHFDFGQGNPPVDAAAAFGGGIPLIIDGLRYGPEKVFDSSNNLVVQSNLGYASWTQEPDSTGKVILAYSSRNDHLAIAFQPDGAANGKSITEIQNYLAARGYDNALAFDGSSSATLVVRQSVVFSPAYYKNASINIGIGVTLPKSH